MEGEVPKTRGANRKGMITSQGTGSGNITQISGQSNRRILCA